METPPIEDELPDILAKAMAGQGIGYRELGRRAGLDEDDVRSIREGSPSSDILPAIAGVLDLNAEALNRIRAGRYDAPDTVPENVLRLVFPFRSWTVNAYIIEYDEQCIVIDTGTSSRLLLDGVGNLFPAAVLLTHTHTDHVGGIAGLLSAPPGTLVLSPRGEPWSGADPLDPNEILQFDGCEVRALPTSGHSPDGLSYLTGDHCFCGDALFAGSVGGCAGDYEGALERIRREILSLPPETILLPGHGPATTVRHETEHNPFFAAGRAGGY